MEKLLVVPHHTACAGSWWSCKETASSRAAFSSGGCCPIPKLPDPCPYFRHPGHSKAAWPGTRCPSSLCPQLNTFFLTGRGLTLPYPKPYAKQWCHTRHKLFCPSPQGTDISLPLQFCFSIVSPRWHYTLPCCRLDPLCTPQCPPARTCLDTGVWLGLRWRWQVNDSRAVFVTARFIPFTQCILIDWNQTSCLATMFPSSITPPGAEVAGH